MSFAPLVASSMIMGMRFSSAGFGGGGRGAMSSGAGGLGGSNALSFGAAAAQSELTGVRKRIAENVGRTFNTFA